MSKPKKMPLIGYLLWPREECGQINLLIKNILNLFVISISIGIPANKIDILSVSIILTLSLSYIFLMKFFSLAIR